MLKRIAPAKLNLGLHVLRRRTDGYHDIETVMTPIGWADYLQFEPAPDFRFTAGRDDIPTDERNLCVRAAKALANAIGEPLTGHLHLDKNIPHGAGLGGGSSDAAATLLLLREAWQAPVPDSALHELASSIGSDVPFFLGEGPALVKGRGEEVSRLPDNLDFVRRPCAVVMPNVHVSTAEAYALVEPNEVDRPDILAILASNDLDRWQRELVNDFEIPLIKKHPEIGRERNALLQHGARYTAMTGSGAAVFGLFDSPEQAKEAANDARKRGLKAHFEE